MDVRTLGAALLLILTGLAAGPADAEQVPPGSYRATCRDVRVVAGWLKATCRDSHDRWVEATTAVDWCGAGRDIANVGGRLVCQAAPARSGSTSGGGIFGDGFFGSGGSGGNQAGGGSFGERPPSGSYQSSCRDIRMVAGWLKASCQDSRGRWVDATTAASWCSAGRDIANVDGRLTCR